MQRGKLFSKILREITVAAKHGGGDPKANHASQGGDRDPPRRRTCPPTTSSAPSRRERAEAPGEQYEDITYEGYGPGGVAVLVRVLTDNKNRTGPEIRHIFEKQSGRMGTAGCVAWMFDRRGVIQVDAEKSKEDEVLEQALEAGASDVRTVEKVFEITTTPDEMETVRQALEVKGIPRHRGAGVHGPQSTVRVEGKDAAAVAAIDRGPRGTGRRAGRLFQLRHPRRGLRRHLRGLARCGSWAWIRGLSPPDSAVLESRAGRRHRRWTAGVITTSSTQPLEARLNAIYRAVHQLIETQKPTFLVVEDLYSEYKFPRTAILMGHARGVVYLAARQLGVGVTALAPSEVKRAMTGNGSAGKAQVQRGVQTLLGLQDLPRPSHVADALRPRRHRPRPRHRHHSAGPRRAMSRS